MRIPSIKSLRLKTWKLMSEYSRRKTANHADMVQCVSCGKSYHWKEVDAGHFLHEGSQGNISKVSYDDRNIWPQCRGCNFFGAKGESSPSYSKFMYQKFGFEILDELKSLKRQAMSRSELIEKQVELNYKLQQLSVNQRSLKWKKQA